MEFSRDSNKQLHEVLHRLHEVYTQAKEERDDIGRAIRAVCIAALDLICKENAHPSLVKLALGIHLTHNQDAHKLGVVPPPIRYHTDFANLRPQQASSLASTTTPQPPQPEQQPLSNPVSPDTMTGVEILSYFREDYDFNDHHYHWHMVYPYSGHVETAKPTKKSVKPTGKSVHKPTIDRQGELFLYMHSQMIARYNTELLCWGLDILHAWGYDDVVPFGYDPVPSMRDLWGARPKLKGWYETHNPHLEPDEIGGFPPIEDMIRWRDNIFAAIKEGYFQTDIQDGKFELTPDNAANLVGVVLEAQDRPLQEVRPDEFINRDTYGNVHNLGHDKFAEIGYHWFTSDKNPFDVMASNICSARDPCFWLWHRHIDDFRTAVVKKYTQSLDEHQPKGLKIESLKITRRTTASDKNAPPIENGVLLSFLGPPQLQLNEANAKMGHYPYQWEVSVSTTLTSFDRDFIVRLFIAPTSYIQDQRFWIEMDKFNETITKQGKLR